jgi:sodium transport system permease protein
MPLFLLTMPLIFLTLAPGVELSPFYTLVPVTGVALLMQNLMTAAGLDQVPWLYFIPVLAPIVLYSSLALRWAIEQFNREEVLFREAERLDLRLWLFRLFREKGETTSTGQAMFGFGLILALAWFFQSQGSSPLVHSTISQIAFVASPALLMAIILHQRPGETFWLHWPHWREMALAGVLALLILPFLAAIVPWALATFPGAAQLLQDRQPLVAELRVLAGGKEFPSTNIVSYLLAYAFLPALAQEFAFRGFILTGLLKRFRPRTAILLTSFFFALTT